jgi:adenosylcobinamide-phosphate synthase
MSYGTYYFTYITLPLVIGFIMDILLSEPKHMTHPVVMIGKLISKLEKHLLKEDKNKRAAGAATVAIVCITTLAAAVLIPAVSLAAGYHAGLIMSRNGLIPWMIRGTLAEIFCARVLCVAVLSVMCGLMLAARSLWQESMKVHDALVNGDDVESARHAVSMIVGRDTSVLDREGIIKAAVETVAENTSDGVTAPMFWMAVLGIPGMYLYKAVNTMDSMIGYKNEKYIDFGRCAARLDDIMNLIPARITALIMIFASCILPGYSGRGAWKIWKRDRRKHASPNSAQTESVCAGALGIRLAGPAVYFGVLHSKSFIGDEKRNITPSDIKRANILMLVSSVIMLLTAVAAGIIR